jgi:hypothetical protein
MRTLRSSLREPFGDAVVAADLLNQTLNQRSETSQSKERTTNLGARGTHVRVANALETNETSHQVLQYTRGRGL